MYYYWIFAVKMLLLNLCWFSSSEEWTFCCNNSNREHRISVFNLVYLFIRWYDNAQNHSSCHNGHRAMHCSIVFPAWFTAGNSSKKIFWRGTKKASWKCGKKPEKVNKNEQADKQSLFSGWSYCRGIGTLICINSSS